jgi:hypothetical protein
MIKSTKIFKLHRLLFVEYTSNRSKKKTRYIYAPLAYQIPSITQILASRSSALFATCQNYTPRAAPFFALSIVCLLRLLYNTRVHVRTPPIRTPLAPHSSPKHMTPPPQRQFARIDTDGGKRLSSASCATWPRWRCGPALTFENWRPAGFTLASSISIKRAT